jgi:hypothetical protein
MTVTVQQTTNTSTFEFWLNRTNELANAMTTVVVSTNSNTAVGNAAISGRFTANVISVANSTVNTSISVPTAAEKSSGDYYLNANGSWAQIVTPILLDSNTTTGTSSQILDSYALASVNGAEYTVHIKDNNANGYQITKLLTVHNNTTAFITEYGTITTNNTLGTFAATTNSSHVIINVTPLSSNTDISFAKVTV